MCFLQTHTAFFVGLISTVNSEAVLLRKEGS